MALSSYRRPVNAMRLRSRIERLERTLQPPPAIRFLWMSEPDESICQRQFRTQQNQPV